jgi:hypothetical protein
MINLTFLPIDNILNAIRTWKSLVKTLATSETSYKSSVEVYELFREMRLRRQNETLAPDDVRLVLDALTWKGSSAYAVSSTYPRRLFFDLTDVWGSTWNLNDFSTIFKILRWNGSFEESMSTMRAVHEREELEHYPGADCWAWLLEGLSDHPDVVILQNCKEVWRLMYHYGTDPTITVFNVLFRLLHRLPEAFDFILEVYHRQLLPSKCHPDFDTLRYLLEAYMMQSPTSDLISAGNEAFHRFLEFKPSKSAKPEYWDTVARWTLFRGKPLTAIKHILYEENAALGRELQGGPEALHLVRPAPKDDRSAALSATLNRLIDLALRLDNAEAANTIYEELFPMFSLAPTPETDELRLDLLIRNKQAKVAKELYDDLHFQNYRPPPDMMLRLLQILTECDEPLPVETQSVFFDLLDHSNCPPQVLSASFSILLRFLLRIEDFPRLRQALDDRYIERVPNWRNIVSSICLEAISDPETIWLESMLPVYHIVQHWAPETITLSHRHSLMHKLLLHGRTDLGMELFHDMRHSDVSQPNAETYSILLSGCARTRDAQTLDHVHDALRLDSSIEPDTSMFNSLMFAYNRSRLPGKALEIWEVLSASSRLPDVETATLALDACAGLPRGGLIRAREIWAFMEKNRIEPVPSSYAALLSVFASFGKWDGMMGLLERMEKDKVNAEVLGTAYNKMKRDRKGEVELWARANKPNEWEYLQGQVQGRPRYQA